MLALFINLIFFKKIRLLPAVGEIILDFLEKTKYNMFND